MIKNVRRSIKEIDVFQKKKEREPFTRTFATLITADKLSAYNNVIFYRAGKQCALDVRISFIIRRNKCTRSECKALIYTRVVRVRLCNGLTQFSAEEERPAINGRRPRTENHSGSVKMQRWAILRFARGCCILPHCASTYRVSRYYRIIHLYNRSDGVSNIFSSITVARFLRRDWWSVAENPSILLLLHFYHRAKLERLILFVQTRAPTAFRTFI